MRIAALALTGLLGCSYVTVNAPHIGETAATTRCTESDVWPSIDSAIGISGIAGAVGGELVDRLTNHHMANYELLVGLPAIVVGIAYLVGASYGTDAVEACRNVKGGATRGCDGCADSLP